jgi:hypothetical protein
MIDGLSVDVKAGRIEMIFDVDDMTVCLRLTPGEAKMIASQLMSAANRAGDTTYKDTNATG